MAADLAFKIKLIKAFPVAIEMVQAALKHNGFGVISDIDLAVGQTHAQSPDDLNIKGSYYSLQNQIQLVLRRISLTAPGCNALY